MTSLL
ncbi:hypothetical protein M8C21_023401 [Ambrosia artemisiifolia]|jgi:hypothetical protein